MNNIGTMTKMRTGLADTVHTAKSKINELGQKTPVERRTDIDVHKGLKKKRSAEKRDAMKLFGL